MSTLLGIFQSLPQDVSSVLQVARFDFAVFTLAWHQETLQALRVAMARTGKPCAVVIEPVGKEILVINRPQAPLQLVAGQEVTLTCDKSAKCSNAVLPVSTLATFEGHGIAPGDTISVGEYLFTGGETTSAYLTVKKVEGLACACTCLRQHVLAGGAAVDDAHRVEGLTCFCTCANTCSLAGLQLTVHIAGVSSPGGALTAEDEKAVAAWGGQADVDFVSIPFTTSAQDVEDCRAMLKRCGLADTRVIAKIEDVAGLRAHQEIIDAADAVVFSRGKLGTRLDVEKVFLAQKLLIRSCNVAGKPVFVTRVIDSMTGAQSVHQEGTRMQATDVANLVLDGADGILLGSETFRGKYPETAVRTVAAICRQAEDCFDSSAYYRASMDLYGSELFINMTKAEALASSAVRAAEKSFAKLMIVFTMTGRTARMLAKYKPMQPILTVVCQTSSSAEYSEVKLTQTQASLVHSVSSSSLKNNRLGNSVMRQCLSYRGVIPIMAPLDLIDSAELLEYAIHCGKIMQLVRGGDRIVVSQCPRKANMELMEEMGVVKLLQVDADPRLGSSSQLNELDVPSPV